METPLEADIIVVGAGISGAVLAERYASLGKKVLVIEKRGHIGGNCYDCYNRDGILVSLYGAHLFHTDDRDVWEYVHRFSEWVPYRHRVLARVDGKLVPIPVNITTVNELLGESLRNENDMHAWLAAHRIGLGEPRNGREAVLARVGPELYEKLFRNYTKKQWDKYPEELDASVLNRIPVRYGFDEGYFLDTYQAQPKEGYTPLFTAMLTRPNIRLLLNTDYLMIKNRVRARERTFYTGPIDRYFSDRMSHIGKLEYRSIRFESETLDREYFQENSVINYPNEEKFTRIVEYKHITGQKHPKTTIVREFTVDTGDPYYPVPNDTNREMYERYRQEAEKLKDVVFVGRLANYKYFNMDQAFKNALDVFYELEGNA